MNYLYNSNKYTQLVAFFLHCFFNKTVEANQLSTDPKFNTVVTRHPSAGLTAVTAETLEEWGTAVATGVEKLDPVRGAPALRELLQLCAPRAAAPDTTSFVICARLYALQVHSSPPAGTFLTTSTTCRYIPHHLQVQTSPPPPPQIYTSPFTTSATCRDLPHHLHYLLRALSALLAHILLNSFVFDIFMIMETLISGCSWIFNMADSATGC